MLMLARAAFADRRWPGAGVVGGQRRWRPNRTVAAEASAQAGHADFMKGVSSGGLIGAGPCTRDRAASLGKKLHVRWRWRALPPFMGASVPARPCGDPSQSLCVRVAAPSPRRV